MAFDLLVRKLNESFTRFTKPLLGASEDGNLYMRFTILPSPPALAFFSHIPDTWLLSSFVDSSNDIKRVDDCARFCLDNIRCLSFDYSNSSQRCYLNSKHSSQALLQPSEYSHYSRNTLEGSFSRPVDTLFSLIDQLIRDGNLTLNSPMLAPERFALKASGIVRVKEEGSREGTTSALRSYTRSFANSKLGGNVERTVPGKSVDDCARLCSDELRFECSAFDFCYIDGSCRWTATQVEGDVTEDLTCDVYESMLFFLAANARFLGLFSDNY